MARSMTGLLGQEWQTRQVTKLVIVNGMQSGGSARRQKVDAFVYVHDSNWR
jgi:hypothetical protein